MHDFLTHLKRVAFCTPACHKKIPWSKHNTSPRPLKPFSPGTTCYQASCLVASKPELIHGAHNNALDHQKGHMASWAITSQVTTEVNTLGCVLQLCKSFAILLFQTPWPRSSLVTNRWTYWKMKDTEKPRHQEVALRMTFESGIKFGDAWLTMKQSPGQG